MGIVHIQRKRDPRFFSLEKVFEQVRDAWEPSTRPDVWQLPRPGISLRNLVHVWYKARSMPSDTFFHVTGDALYVVLALPRRRTTLTIHDCVFLRQRRGIKRFLIQKLSLDWPVSRCRMVTAISEKTKNEVIAHAGCPPSKITVIPNPVSKLIRFVPRPFNEGRPRVLFSGVTANKNLPRALDALKGLSLTLVLLGKPISEQQSLLESAGISHEIHHGLSDLEVARLYEECDMVLFPSLYEGFGLPITESFKAGRPVVTSDIPPMSDIAGDAACLVDPEDVESIRQGVRKICEEAEYREALVRKGLQKAARYESSLIANAYKDFYKKLLSGTE